MTTDGMTPEENEVPNMSIVVHDDKNISNTHKVFDTIIEALQTIELVEPLIINIIHPGGHQQVKLGVTTSNS